MTQPMRRLLVIGVFLAAGQALLLASLSVTPPKLLLQDADGRPLQSVFKNQRMTALAVSASRRIAVPTSGGQCQIDAGIKLVSLSTGRDVCEYCYFIPGPYGCHDSLCYDSLCQYVGVCAGCNEYYHELCSGCAQDRDCLCCE